MESRSNKPPLIVVVGETASGKSALALELAAIFDGEIIAADSRTVYKGMDIGTAKPTQAERAQIPHHLLDVVYPDEAFTAADFKMLAERAITDITSRGKLPILVGGTGLYIDAVLYDFSFNQKADEVQRKRLIEMTVEELQRLLTAENIALPENGRNPRHLIRAYETRGEAAKRKPLRENTLVLGLMVDKEVLRKRITRRINIMIKNGVIEETEKLACKYGWEIAALRSTEYKAFHQYIEARIPLEAAKALCVHNDLRLAKRQRTWFKRNKSIHWICKKAEAVDLITTFLNKSYTA